MTHNLLKELNEKQREAVLASEGPVLILAGPGSGKTRVLTHRIAYLVDEKKIDPEQILAVTFTNKAADEMRVRIRALFSEGGTRASRLPFIGTFHAFAVQILRAHANILGYFPSFSIFDEDDALGLLKEVMKENSVNAKQFAPGILINTISRLKNELVSPEQYAKDTGLTDLFPKILHLTYSAYQKRLKDANAMDFDDLLTNVCALFSARPEIKNRYRERFRYINIDEYQDVNHAQYTLVRDLALGHRNIAVVGDDAQAIYGWRGADMRNILNFEKDWPDARVVVLDQNYRSTQIILDAARMIIEKNPAQKKKNLWTENGAGSPIDVGVAENEQEEAHFIASEIEKLQEKKYRLKDMVVLYRTNAQSRAIEESFLEKKIPYRIIGGVRFYQRKEIKDIIAYLRMLVNPADFVSLKRVINVPTRGIGKIALLSYLARGNRQAYSAKPEPPAVTKFENLISALRKELNTRTASSLIKEIIKQIRYKDYLDDLSSNAQERWENVQEFVSLAAKYDEMPQEEGLKRLLEDVALLTDADETNRGENTVYLMTLHAAKGLEFPIVFIAGLEEGIFPHSRSLFNPQELEEERRLCYVGLTRAKDRVFLSFALRRMRFGSQEVNPPSRFLSELPEEHMKFREDISVIDIS